VGRLDPEAVAARAREVRLLLLDVDGTLTDGAVLVGSDGREAKSFFIRDGAGIVMAQRAGIRVGLLSGRPSEATTRRAAELGIGIVEQGAVDKRVQFDRILTEAGVEASHVAYMGDDLLDLPILARAGLAAAPADAAPEVIAAAHWVSARPGGRGAVRDLVELVLRSQRQWEQILAGLAT
jgi:3-deoxy-D-manno-octulosonate 8-phosphate phosphatase (KDO 8-P phosphatase)